MKKIFLTTCLVLFAILTNARAEFYQQNARECPVLFELEKWRFENIAGGGHYWARKKRWMQKSWESVTGDGILLDPKHKSYSIKSNPKNPAVLVYIGPWQKITLTKGFLWNKEEEQVEIRMIASQRDRYLENHYEIKDEENVKIPEQKFIPLEEPEYLITKCDILRAQQWGYDAVLEGHINIFRGYIGESPLATTGRMINAYTKEVLADFSDQIKEQ